MTNDEYQIVYLKDQLTKSNAELQRVLKSKLLTSDLEVFADLGFPKTAYRIGKELQTLRMEIISAHGQAQMHLEEKVQSNDTKPS